MLSAEHERRDRSDSGLRHRHSHQGRAASRSSERKERSLALGDETGGGGGDSGDEDDALLEESLAEDSTITIDRERARQAHAHGRAEADEHTPLLGGGKGGEDGDEARERNLLQRAKARAGAAFKLAKQKGSEIKAEDVKDAGKTAVTSIPAVILGCASPPFSSLAGEQASH